MLGRRVIFTSISVVCTTLSLAVPGCNGANPASEAGANDGASGDTGSVIDGGNDVADASPLMDGGDSGDASLGCDLTKPFNAPSLVPGVPNIPTRVGSLSPDELTLYFSNFSVTNNVEIFYTTRGSMTDAFGGGGGVAPVAITPLNGPASDWNPAVTADGLTMFFTSNRNSNYYNLWTSTRANTASPWGAPSSASVNSFNKNTDQASISPKGDVLYFFQGVQIFFATCQGTTCSNPQSVFVGGNGASNKPVISADMLSLYISSDRIQPMNTDLFVGTRQNVMQSFSNFVPITELNSVGLEEPGWISADGCRLYFSSTRSGQYQMYYATHPPK